jgi:hypothetical protein
MSNCWQRSNVIFNACYTSSLALTLQLPAAAALFGALPDAVSVDQHEAPTYARRLQL